MSHVESSAGHVHRAESSSELAVIVTAPSGAITTWGLAAERLLGWSTQEAVGLDAFAFLVQPEDRDQADVATDRLTRGLSWEGQLRLTSKHKGGLMASVVASPFEAGSGKPAGWVLVILTRLETAPGELERLLAVEQAAWAAGEVASQWWAQLQSSADTAFTQTSLDELMRQVLGAIRSALVTDSVSILVANEAGDELVARASVGLSQGVLGVQIRSGTGLAGRVMASGQPLIVGDLSDIELASPDLPNSGLRSVVAVPILVEGQIRGVLHAGSYEKAYFRAADAEVLTLVAGRLAAAMERVRLFEREREARRRAEVTTDRLHRVQRITTALLGALDTAAVADVVVDELTEEFGAEKVTTTLWLVEGRALQPVRSAGVTPTKPGEEMAFEDDLAELVHRELPVFATSIAELRADHPALGAMANMSESFALLPLVAHGKALGALAIGFSEQNMFDADDKRFQVAVADQAAQAVDRAKYRQAEVELSEHNAFLAETAATLASSLDYAKTLATVVRMIVPNLADLCTVHLFSDTGVLERVALAHRDPAVEAAIVAHKGEEGDPAVAEMLADAVTHRAVIIEDATRLPVDQGVTNQRAFRALSPLGVGSAVLVPLQSGDRRLGVLSVARIGASRPFGAKEVELAEELGRRAAVAIDNARLHSDLAAAQRIESYLLGVANVLAGAKGYKETLQELAGVAVPALADLCLIDVLDNQGELRRMVAHHADPSREALVEQLRVSYPPSLEGTHPSIMVIREGRSLWSSHMNDEFLRATCHDENHFNLTKALRFTSYMAVPLIDEGKVLGAFTLVSAGSGRRFGRGDLALAEELAAHVAAVVGKARHYDEEHHAAHVLQSSLLPARLPEFPGLKVAVRYLPGTVGAEVGGDFYDLLALPSGRVGFMIGDVAGHDHQAAALMGNLRSAARALAGQVREPAQLVDALQWSWDLLGLDRIATGIFGRLDVSNRDLVLASAGHPPPLLVSGSQAIYLPVEPNSPLGTSSAEAAEWRGTLPPGCALLLYTDGVIEDRKIGLEDGMKELARLASTCPPDPDQLCDTVIGALGEARSDDVALLALFVP